MEINVELFDRICRVCLVQSSELKSLFTKLDGEERHLCEILSFTASIDVKIEDNLPKQVCSTCESIMCKAYAFKRRCLESETILNNVYQNDSACGESSNFSVECSVKVERLDLKYVSTLSEYGTVLSPFPTNSGFKGIANCKKSLLQELEEHPTNVSNFNKFPDSKLVSKCEQQVKQEPVNDFEEGNDFEDGFDDKDQIESPPKESTEKVEKGKSSQGKDGSSKIGIRYECYCHTQFTSKEKYKSHLKANECNAYKLLLKGNRLVIKNQFPCLKCDKQFSTANGWKVHQRSHHNKITDETVKQFQCSFCLRKFNNKISLAAHIQRHEVTDNIKHTCEVCKREFKYKAYLENHILTTHSKTNGFTCDICAQSFSNKETLETHKKSHESEKKHRCTVCSKAFFMLCTLKEHMRTHTGEKPFLCSQCGKGFSQKTNLAQHMRRHQGLKPFKCDNCEKRFVSKGELDAHNRKHSGAHPFVCDECGNGFTTSSALVKHRRIHTGERPYKCDLCPMRFAASGTLKNHRRTHTGERPFQCSYCEKAFVQRNDLISHIRCHTGERPYICTQCGQSFRKASGLKTHVKLHIKDPVVGINAVLTSMHCREQ